MFSGRSTRIVLAAIAFLLVMFGVWSERQSLMSRLSRQPIVTQVLTGTSTSYLPILQAGNVSEPSVQTTAPSPFSFADFFQRTRPYWALGGLALGSFVLLLLAPALALPLLILATALNRFRFDIASAGLRLEHLALVAVAGVWLIQFLRRQRRPRFEWDDAVLAFYWFIALIASYLNAPSFIESVKFLGLMGLAFATYWVVKAFVADEKTFRRMVVLLLLVGVGEALFGITAWSLIPFGLNLGVQFYAFGPNSGYDISCRNFTYSPYGTQFEPNIFGSYTLGITLVLMTLLLSSAGHTRSRLVLAGIVVGIVAVALSLTRGALAGFGVGALAILAFAEGKWFDRLKLTAVAAVVLAVAVVVSTELPERLVRSPESTVAFELSQECAQVIRPQPFLTGTTPRGPGALGAGETPRLTPTPPRATPTPGPDSTPAAQTPGGFMTLERLLTSESVSYRLDSWVRAVNDWLDHPWLGNGANAFAQRYITTSRTRDWIDNVELMALHDTGLIGLAVLLFWFVAGTIDLVRAIRRSPPSYTRTLLLGLALSFIGLLVAYQVTTAFWLGFTWVYLGLMRAGTLILQRHDDTSAS